MKENEIRPKELLTRYLNLVESDSKKLDKTKFLTISCPACGSDQYRKHIQKTTILTFYARDAEVCSVIPDLPRRFWRTFTKRPSLPDFGRMYFFLPWPSPGEKSYLNQKLKEYSNILKRKFRACKNLRCRFGIRYIFGGTSSFFCEIRDFRNRTLS